MDFCIEKKQTGYQRVNNKINVMATYLCAEHVDEVLDPSRHLLRHLLGEVGATGADDELLVRAILVDVVDRAAQDLDRAQVCCVDF